MLWEFQIILAWLYIRPIKWRLIKSFDCVGLCYIFFLAISRFSWNDGKYLRNTNRIYIAVATMGAN